MLVTLPKSPNNHHRHGQRRLRLYRYRSAPPTITISLLTIHVLGGALKLKGVKGGGIPKKKKKKSTKKSASTEPELSANTDVQKQPESAMQASVEEEDDDPYAGKTPTERRFEERKREQMEKKQAKEGVKTHKERVEEYNKYLASLSEHHDMCVPSVVLFWECGLMLTSLPQAENRAWLIFDLHYYCGGGGCGSICVCIDVRITVFI